MFLARISKGRTIGQFVTGTLTIPFLYIVMWVTMFGNSAIERIRGGDAAFGESAVNAPETGFFDLLQQYPAATFIIGLATFVGLLFYVTSADSGALVMANLSSTLPDPETDAKPWVRILWAAATGLLTVAMLVVGGIKALQSATVVMGLPFAVVMVLVMIGLHRALEGERRQSDALRASLRSSIVSAPPAPTQGSWRNRLARQFGTVSLRTLETRMTSVVEPALEEVAAELRNSGVDAVVGRNADPSRHVARTVTLTVHAQGPGFDDFHYLTHIRRVKVASYGSRMVEADDTSCQLEVVVPGGGTYEIDTYTKEQIAHDVLDHYQWWVGSVDAVATEAAR